jgi:hypothetical protein
MEQHKDFHQDKSLVFLAIMSFENYLVHGPSFRGSGCQYNTGDGIKMILNCQGGPWPCFFDRVPSLNVIFSTSLC